MKIDDITKLDWKKDKNLLAVQQKLAGLAERETHERSRIAELDQIVRDAERSIVHARAAAMLSEASDEPAEEIQERLNSARCEIVDLHGNLEALALARKRLEPAVAAAMAEAKLAIALMLAPAYQDATEALRTHLEQAIKLNQVLHVIHGQAVKCDLRRETAGRADLKPLGFPMAWNVLGLSGGQPSAELSFWHNHIDKLYGAN